MDIRGPFFDIAGAARYCCFAPGTFTKIIRQFDLPKAGPKKNRFAASILDAWMASPETFKKATAPRRRTPKPVTV